MWEGLSPRCPARPPSQGLAPWALPAWDVASRRLPHPHGAMPPNALADHTPSGGTSRPPGQPPGQVRGALCPAVERSMDSARSSGRHREGTSPARHPASSRAIGEGAVTPPGHAVGQGPSAGPGSPGGVQLTALGRDVSGPRWTSLSSGGGDSQARGRHPGGWEAPGLGDLGEPPSGGSRGLPWSVSTPRCVFDRRWRLALQLSFCVNKQELLVPNQGICVN